MSPSKIVLLVFYMFEVIVMMISMFVWLEERTSAPPCAQGVIPDSRALEFLLSVRTESPLTRAHLESEIVL